MEQNFFLPKFVSLWLSLGWRNYDACTFDFMFIAALLTLTPKHWNIFIHSYTLCIISLHKQHFLKRLFPQRSMVRLDNYVSLQSWNIFCSFMSIQALPYISISPTMVFCILFQLCFLGTGWVLSCFKVNYLCIFLKKPQLFLELSLFVDLLSLPVTTN